MTRWQAVTIFSLLLLPLVLFAALATWAFWELGWFLWLWAVIPVCWAVAWLLARRWETGLLPLGPPKIEPSLHWTARDEKAWELIEARARTVKGIPPARLTEIQFYADTAKELSLELATLYHPKAQDPFGSLTVPEILAAAELATEDLAELVDRYLPGGHLVTVNRWRSLARLPDWYAKLEKIYWPLSAVVSPATFIGRYAASRWILTPMTDLLQSNMLAWFYVAFVQRVGLALIELNSGRLRGGARRFRRAMAELSGEVTRPAAASPVGVEPKQVPAGESTPTEVTLCLIGQVKAGKSSLANALLGEHHAATDILPLTSEVTRYRLTLPNRADQLVLLDTPGYSVDGATKRQLEETQEAVRQSDLVLMVMNVTSPAREPDRQFLQALADWFDSQPQLKLPPIVGVLTHIDLLSPVMEWAPPYDWREPQQAKERTIRDAVAYNQEQLGRYLTATVPVCTDAERGRVYGIDEWLLPVTSVLLDEARACALVRSLHAELDRQKFRRVLQQFSNVGQQMVQIGAGAIRR